MSVVGLWVVGGWGKGGGRAGPREGLQARLRGEPAMLMAANSPVVVLLRAFLGVLVRSFFHSFSKALTFS